MSTIIYDQGKNVTHYVHPFIIVYNYQSHISFLKNIFEPIIGFVKYPKDEHANLTQPSSYLNFNLAPHWDFRYYIYLYQNGILSYI